MQYSANLRDQNIALMELTRWLLSRKLLGDEDAASAGEFA